MKTEKGILSNKLNPEHLLELMKLGASITIPCREGLELNFGQVSFNGLSDSIELELFGDKCSPGSKYFYQLSLSGVLEAISFADSEIDKFLDVFE
jgi:hypothetical protein